MARYKFYIVLYCIVLYCNTVHAVKLKNNSNQRTKNRHLHISFNNVLNHKMPYLTIYHCTKTSLCQINQSKNANMQVNCLREIYQEICFI